jgi:hypothetical protein
VPIILDETPVAEKYLTIGQHRQQTRMPTMAMGKIKMQTVILDFEDSVIFQWQPAAQNEREAEEEFGFHGFRL